MTLVLKETSPRRSAIIAGLGLLIMAILAPIANFVYINGNVVLDDAIKTIDNIISSEGSFRVGIGMLLTVAILDIIVAWSLFVLLKPVNKSLSLLTALFRIVYAAILIAALVNLTDILQLLNSARSFKEASASQLQLQVMLSYKSFNQGWNLGMVLFSIHLFLLGYLIFKSGFIPKLIGVLVIIASLGYFTDSFGTILSSGYKLVISKYTFIGELILMLWLLISGFKASKWQATKV